jgi:protein PsiE
MNQRISNYTIRAGNMLTGIFHHIALFAIGATTVWAAGATFLGLLEKSHATIADILLLFIYLEIGAMVGIYFRTNHMPVRFLLYIAITALTRHMVNEMLAVAGATLIMTISVLLVRYTSWRYPSDANQSRSPHD